MISLFMLTVYLFNFSTLKSILNFDLDCPIRTVYRTLEEINCLNMLSDPILNVATAEVIPEGKSKSAIRECIRAKERAVEHLVKKYSPKDDKNAQDLLRSCIYSMSDYNAYVRYGITSSPIIILY